MVKNDAVWLIIGVVAVFLLANRLDLMSLVGVGDEGMLVFDDFESGLSLGSCQYLGINSGVARYSMRDAVVCEGDKYIFTGTSNANLRLNDAVKLREGLLEISPASQPGQYGLANHAPFLIKRDFYANDVKINFKVGGSPNRVLRFYVNDNVVYDFDTGTIGTNKLSHIMSFEIKSGDLNPNELAILLNGNLLDYITISGNEKTISWGDKSFSGKLLVSMSSNSDFFIKNVLYKVPFACGIPDDHMLAMETFGSGSEVDIFSTRYEVKRFCLDHPVIRTSSEYSGSDTTAEPYLQWIKGKSLTVPDGETWTMFYIFDNSDGDVLTVCNIDESYNVDKERCENEVGIVNLCSEGVYDSTIGACAVTGVDTECSFGRLELRDGLKRCIYNPPVDQVCEAGTFNPSTGTCQALNSFVCPVGYDRKVVDGQTVCTTTLKEFETVYVEVASTLPVEPAEGLSSSTIIIVLIGLFVVMFLMINAKGRRSG